MILLIYDFFTHSLGWKLPIVFTYYSTRMILAALTSLILSIFLGSYFIRKLYEFKIGQTVRSEDYGLIGKLHANKKDTPTMGGVLILFTMLVSMLLWMDLQHPFTLLFFLTTVILGLAGGYDDYKKIRHKNVKGLSGRKKLLIQAFVSSLVVLYMFVPAVSEWLHHGDWFVPPVIKQGHTEISLSQYASLLYVPFVKGPFLNFTGLCVIFVVILAFLVIMGSSNSVNLTDGLDGLAAGCLILVASTLALFAFLSNHIEFARYLNIAYIEGSGEIAIYLCAFAGGCLGFLWYNGFPAQVFMGDVGSLTLGGILGVATVLLKRELLLAIIGGIFVSEAMSVILQVASFRWRNQKRIFLCAPLHHHFEYLGWPETKVVLRFWIIGLLLALVGIASLKFQ
ncbi:MAG: phospho-N-acetylmuramoyl-pentapeptide-transferase [Chlamydiales bacterium]|nr:phospho-N-acetylmuramoyl-pentapeptide-transferase [Chlamydiales bacterium]